MPKWNDIVNLPGIVVKRVLTQSPICLEVVSCHKVRCIHCHSKQVRKKARITRRVLHEPMGYRNVYLQLNGHKFYCRACQRYFNQRFEGILPRYRCTQRLKEYVFTLHLQGVSQKDLSTRFRASSSSVERWFGEYYWRANQKLKERECPRVLGIDEHRFGRKLKYATTLCHLGKRRIFDVLPGKSKASLAEHLDQLSGKEKVRVICIDLCTHYKALCRHYFPNAKIVADRFHVIKLVNEAFLKTYHQLDPRSKHQRGVLNVLRTREDRLNERQKYKRDEYFKQFPQIEAVYLFKQGLHQLLMHKHRRAFECRALIPQLLDAIKQLKQSGFSHLRRLGKTLEAWQEEIVRMWRFTKNNGITEGFHRKMKLIQRRAYGFRNFYNYRMRVRMLCA